MEGMTGKPVPRPSVAELRALLHRRLTDAMKARDKVASDALRSAMAAIGNAEAVPVDDSPMTGTDSPVAGAAVGVGATEADRRELTLDDVRQILTDEVEDRQSAARELDTVGHPDRADVLRRQADVLAQVLRDSAES